MKQYTLYQIDAFTKTRFKGNPAGVVVNADGLLEEQMQAIARELNNSETAFLFSPVDNSCDGIIRYFTPTIEVPICGHATIAAMYAKAIEEGTDSCVLKMKTNVGVLPFEIVRSGEAIKVWMTQGKIEIDPPFSEEVEQQLIGYLGLLQGDRDKRCPVQIVSAGHSKVMIGITSRERLNDLKPNFQKLAELSSIIDCNGYFVFTLNSADSDVLSYGRMFAPAIGINEDPVTGNANGPLGAYLVHNKLVDTESDSFTFKGVQGEAIGREGIVEVSVSITHGEPRLIRIAGEAVTLFKTSIEL